MCVLCHRVLLPSVAQKIRKNCRNSGKQLFHLHLLLLPQSLFRLSVGWLFYQRGADADSGRDENSTPPVPPRTTELHRMEAELLALRDGHSDLHGQVARQETELNKLRAQMGSVREERDRLKRKVREKKQLCTQQTCVGSQRAKDVSSYSSSFDSVPVCYLGANKAVNEKTVGGGRSCSLVSRWCFTSAHRDLYEAHVMEESLDEESF